MPCDVHAMAASMQKHSQIPWGWLPACKCQCGSVHDGDHNSVARNLEGLALKQWQGDKSICNSTTKVEVCTLLESVHNVTMTVWSEFFTGLSCVLWSLINYTTQNPYPEFVHDLWKRTGVSWQPKLQGLRHISKLLWWWKLEHRASL